VSAADLGIGKHTTCGLMLLRNMISNMPRIGIETNWLKIQNGLNQPSEKTSSTLTIVSKHSLSGLYHFN
jgi:hypothetical protein